MTKTIRVSVEERDAAMRRHIARSGFQINVTPELRAKVLAAGQAPQMRSAAARAVSGAVGRQRDYAPAGDGPTAHVPFVDGAWSWTGWPVPPTLLTRARLAQAMVGLGSSDDELRQAVGLSAADAAELLALHAEVSKLRQRLREADASGRRCGGQPTWPAALRSQILRAAGAASTGAVPSAGACLSRLSRWGRRIRG